MKLVRCCGKWSLEVHIGRKYENDEEEEEECVTLSVTGISVTDARTQHCKIELMGGHCGQIPFLATTVTAIMALNECSDLNGN